MATILGFDFLADQRLVLVEGETGGVQAVYALSIARDALKKGRKVTYITHHDREDVLKVMDGYALEANGMEIADNVSEWRTVPIPEGALVVLDSLPFFSAEDTREGMRRLVSDMARAARPGRTILLLSETGILHPSHELLASALADGVVRFVAEREGEKIRRFIHVPKMRGYLPIDRMIPFTLTEQGILIDPRERYG
ncbi:MAG TPA: ATPase domain-containing protein [Methanomicrobiales archaeon]|nr:ATPase domain-containing protein [Methanomicrobiales archaeon]